MFLIAKILVLGFLITSALPTEQRKVGINIIGGTEASPHEYPFIAAIRRYGGFTTYQWCGATILSANWILTAAHCITALDNTTTFSIVAGDHDATVEEGTEQRRNVQQIIIHSNFSTLTYANDIALFRVSSPFEFNAYVQPLSVTGNRLSHWDNAKALAMGWGRLRPEGTLPSRLMHVNLTLVGNEDCKNAYGQDMILDSMICAGEELGGKDTCRGDTGGPLILNGARNNPTLIGISSWGLGCGTPGFPGVYTNVGSFTHWILERIRKP